MPLVPCTTGTLALFAQEDGGALRGIPVEAWGDDGVPYIAGPAGLAPATAESGLVRLHPQVTTVRLPGVVRQPDPDDADRRDRETADRQRTVRPR